MHLEAVRKKNQFSFRNWGYFCHSESRSFYLFIFYLKLLVFNSDIFRVKNRNVFFSRCHHSCLHFLKGKILTFSHFSFGSIFVCGVIKHMKSKYKKRLMKLNFFIILFHKVHGSSSLFFLLVMKNILEKCTEYTFRVVFITVILVALCLRAG